MTSITSQIDRVAKPLANDTTREVILGLRRAAVRLEGRMTTLLARNGARDVHEIERYRDWQEIEQLATDIAARVLFIRDGGHLDHIRRRMRRP